VFAPCLTKFYNRKNTIDIDDWHVGFSKAQRTRVFVGTGTTLVEVEQSSALALGVEGTVSLVGDGAGTMCSVSGVGCVSPMGGDGRVIPVGGVGRMSQGAVVLNGFLGIILMQGLEKEQSGFNTQFGVSLVEEVVLETLEEVAGVDVSWKVSMTKGKGRVVSPMLKENDCACSSERLAKVNDLAGVLVTNGDGRSLRLDSSKVTSLSEEGSVLANFQYEESNLVDVRVVQVDYLFQQSGPRAVSNFRSDSAIENCSKIYKLKNEVFEAAKIWKSGTKMSYTFSGQEDVVIRSLQSMENWDNSKWRNVKGEITISDDESS